MSQAHMEFMLSFTYDEQEKPTLQDVSGTVSEGRCICLCGSSGCGKSTLLRCINHLIPQFYEGTLKGFCRLKGQDTQNLSIGEMGMEAASVFQDPRSQFFTLNSSTEIAFGLENFGLSQKEMTEKVDTAFAHFHLQRLKDRNVFTLSSGERQLTAILAAWALDTDLFLLDEPTANLDYHAISQFSETLKALKHQQKTMVISEHRLYYLKGIADEYWVMEQGQIVKKYRAEEMEALSPAELQALGLRTTDLSRVSTAEGVLPGSIKDPFIFEAKHIAFHYPGKEVLEDLSLTEKAGEVIALTGHNGCGKTTFGKTAAGLLKASGGSFLLNGKTLSRKALCRNSIFIMQEAEFQFFTNSVLHELAYNAKDWEHQKQEAEDLLKLSGLWELRNRHPFSLSGGQMQKLVLLLACLSPKPVAILDEPTAGLDYKSLQTCTQLIQKMQKTKLVFIITHDLELISLCCTRCIEIQKGRVVSDLKLSEPGSLNNIRAAMEAALPPALPPKAVKKPYRQLDPRGKLFIVLMAMCAGIYTDLALITCVFLAVAAAAIYEKRYGLIFTSLALMGAMIGAYLLWPTVGFSFLAHFFPRIILMGAAALLILSENQAPRTLAALRSLHVPEKAIMIFAIVFRFFPVLQGDLQIMHQSMATRGMFQSLSEKLKAIPQYLEMVLVPMVFRVLRISETLSASAETRGIALKNHRESYISLSFRFPDLFFVSLTVILAFIGLIL